MFYSKNYLIKELIKKKNKLFLKDNEHKEFYMNENNNLCIKENYRCNNCNSYKSVKPNIVFFGGSAPMYSYLNRALEYLKNPDSIIIGTMGNVVQINEKIKKYPC